MADDTAGRWLGIDIGSTATKATVFDADGAALATARHGYSIDRPAPDRAEQDPADWWRAVEHCAAAVAAQTSLAGVRGVGITGQVDTHVPVDEHLAVLRPALVWQDVRSAAEASELDAELGAAGRRAAWGSDRPLVPSGVVPRARWLARHEPQVWARCHTLLLPKDYVGSRLTGTVVTDPLSSYAVVGDDGDYLPGVAHAEGLRRRLPPLHPPESLPGATRDTWHGVPGGTPVTTGTMDAFANVLGSGLHEPGDTMIVLGTSAIVAAIGTRAEAGQGVIAFRPFHGRCVHAGPTQSGGESLRWWAAATGHAVEEVLAAAQATPDSGEVIFAPHLLGERAPLWDARVRGWFTGLDAGSDFGRLSRAVLEGVAYSVRELLDAVRDSSGVPTRRIVLSGGGARSPLWAQILADVLGRPLLPASSSDTAVAGAAILAAAAVSGDDPWTAAAALGRHDPPRAPDIATAERYTARFALYRSTYGALRTVHDDLAALRDEPDPG